MYVYRTDRKRLVGKARQEGFGNLISTARAEGVFPEAFVTDYDYAYVLRGAPLDPVPAEWEEVPFESIRALMKQFEGVPNG